MHKKLQGKNFNSRMLAKVYQAALHIVCRRFSSACRRNLVPKEDLGLFGKENFPMACKFVKHEEPWNPDGARIVGGALVCGSEEPVKEDIVKVPTQETALNHLKLFFGIKGRLKKKEEDEEVVPVKARDSDSDSSDESETEEEESDYSEEEPGGDSDS
jgi:hypothetical protein